MHDRISPSIQRGRRLIEKLLAQEQYRREGRLPTIARMCRMAHVSASTMVKAVGNFAGQGKVRPERKRGILLLDQSGTPLIDNEPVDETGEGTVEKWQHISSLIERDIMEGFFQPGKQFPLVKELERRYKTSYPTIRKALAHLECLGILQRAKRSYCVAMQRHAFRSTIIFLVPHARLDETIRFHSPRFEEFIKALQIQCMQRNIRLEIVSAFESGRLSAKKSALLQQLKRSQKVLGYIVWAPGMAAIENVIDWVSAQRVPAAVIDEEVGEGGMRIRGSSIRMFPVGTSGRAAQRIGEYLLRMGHRKTAFLTYGNFAWSSVRWERLRGVAREAGDGAVIEQVHVGPLMEEYSFKRESVISKSTRDFMAMLHDLCVKLEGRAQKAAQAFLRELDSLCRDPLFEQRFFGPLEKLSRRKDITAWIAVNDIVAAHALLFARDRGIGVPRDISIVSFDNTVTALAFNITSYDFNVPGIVSAALAFLLKTSPAYFSGASPIVETEGQIIERETTAAR